MTITNQLFKATGEKIECILLTEDAIQLLSKECATPNEFNEAWNKKLTLATKAEIALKDIKSITKEEGEDHIVIKSGKFGEYHLTFQNADELQAFFAFFQNERGFVISEEAMSPMKSAMPYVWGLVATFVVTGLGYFLSISGDEHTGSVRKGRWVLSLVEMLGSTGVLLLGFAISAYVGYMIRSRYQNPPMQTRLVPAV
jgi:hypothetical protein